MGFEIRPQRFVRPYLRKLARRYAPPYRRRDRTHREELSQPSVARRDLRAARPLPLRHPAGRPDDRYRQQSANRFAVELLRHRPQEARRLLRRHHPHGRGAGADHETARRRGTRSLAPAPHGQSRAQLGAHVDGYRPLHGALLQLDARGGAGRPPRCADADHLDQAPRRRALHRRQGGHVEGDGRQRLGQDRRRVHARGHRRQTLPPAVPHRRRETDVRAGYRRPSAVEEDHPQRMEVGRAGRAVLGYDPARKRPRLLCRRRVQHRLDQSVRRNSALPLRLVPSAGAESLQLRRQTLHRGGVVRFRKIPRPRGQGHAHDGRHHRPGTGKGRADHRQDRRPKRPISATWRATSGKKCAKWRSKAAAPAWASPPKAT